METLKYVVQQNVVAGVVLFLIMTGIITKPSQIPGDISDKDIQQLGGVMQCENDSNGDECKLLTGSVVLNRVNSPNWKGDTIEEIVLAKGQYASKTRNNFKTIKVSKHNKLLAKYLLTYGSVAPSSVVYQGMTKNGSGVYMSIDCRPNQSKPELFCYE